MSIAADIIAAVQEGRQLLQDDIWQDQYEVVRATPGASDNAGGTLDPVPVTVEAGRCKFRPYLEGNERAIAERLSWTAGGAVDLRIDTLLTPSDTLTVNGRTFQVGAVSRGGVFGVRAVAIVQEIG